MQGLSNKLVYVAGGLVLLAVIGFFYIGASQKQSNKEETTAQEQEKTPVEQIANKTSVAGAVGTVNQSKQSFVFTEDQTGQNFTVRVGSDTTFTQLIAPTGAEGSFVFETNTVDLSALQTGQTIFVSSSHPIDPKGDIVDPVEIRIVP